MTSDRLPKSTAPRDIGFLFAPPAARLLASLIERQRVSLRHKSQLAAKQGPKRLRALSLREAVNVVSSASMSTGVRPSGSASAFR
jgi:hypothetical protein